MFRRKQDDDDPFAALKEANARGETRISTGGPAPADPSGGGSASAGDSGPPRPRPEPIVLGGSGDGAPSGVPGTPKRRRNGPLVLLTLVASVAAAGALVVLSDSPADTASERGWFREGGSETGSGTDGGGKQGGEKQGGGTPAERVDLVQPTGFGSALSLIERRLRGGERVWLLRVARDRVNALTRLRNGDQRSIDVAADLSTRVTDSGSAGSHKGMPVQQISAFAPSLATRNAAAKAGISTRKLDYLVMTTPFIAGDKADWQIFFRGVSERDSHFSASLDGRTVRRPGEQSTTTSTLRITTNGRTRTISGAQAQRISACIRRAGGDGARIRRCLP
ncbi:hypothetical protein Q5424_10975 [Conexibacter sp. JD483]|uniref:hypothetical protein n=1 Tax=unclassified Conexibacter TaxID=2627773 RepID=UPI002724246C|nr:MULTISPECIES: hypothetical protein [unclassified Conexibacter]MDO8184307.1 hypothetical protein [Conexibacter sp. CPCC 205706]MDO8197613.1 hypothetical protein [Conexibacter sp. CPCC 205762]MDR9369606.1 hypothetical protein [Conexibacter sp. JD483]